MSLSSIAPSIDGVPSSRADRLGQGRPLVKLPRLQVLTVSRPNLTHAGPGATPDTALNPWPSRLPLSTVPSASVTS
ncbi:hypothetical protein D3C77_555090 [compost metagenome]